jgi:N,N-dimethylformamidase beta subunit-like protein
MWQASLEGRRRVVRQKGLVLAAAAVVLSLAAGVAWGLARPVPASSAHREQQKERAEIHTKDAKPVGAAGATVGIRAPWVIQENAKPGTSDWRLGPNPGKSFIEGYADKVSAQQGERVSLFVSTDAPSFVVEAYRIGYYAGLGGRLIWRSTPVTGVKQAKPVKEPRTNMIEARWSPSLSVPLSSSFPQGDYLFKLVASTGAQQYVPLTLRDDRSTAAFVVQNSVTTWQAYNLWGGASLYEGANGYGGSDPEHRSRVVSYDRPYKAGGGAQDFPGSELPFVSLVESLGLDVTYWTDVDLHQRGELLTRHKALLSLSHDEYWSRAMRTHAETARDRGVNIAFFGANAIYRHIRLEPSSLGANRHQVNYRNAREDPLYGKDNKDVTSEWRSPPVTEPESTIIGNYYECNPVRADMVVADETAWVFAGTDLPRGARLHNVVGSEYDRYDPLAPGPKNVQILAHSPLRCRGKASYSDMTYYTTPSGAGVLATGTNDWISKMSEDCPGTATYTCPKSALIKITTNVLNLFGAGPAGVSHPSVKTDLKALQTLVPFGKSDDLTNTSTTVVRRRVTATTTYTYYSPPTTTRPRSAPPTVPPTTPTTRSRGLLPR